MERKTDQSVEFSGSFDPQMEFCRGGERDAVTNCGLEFNRDGAGEREFDPICHGAQHAFDRETDGSGTGSGGKKGRNFLLQAAAVGLGVVLVTNSFGSDLLGDDALFRGSSSSANTGVGDWLSISDLDDNVYEIWHLGAWAEELDFGYEGDSRVILCGPDWDGLGGAVRYEPESNTLYLRDCELLELNMHFMSGIGKDITVHVQGDVKLRGIHTFGGNNVVLTGTPGSTLSLSMYEYGAESGIHMLGNDSIRIGPDITVTVGGFVRAITINGTHADPAILFDETKTSVSGEIVSGDFFADPDYLEPGGTDWTVLDETGQAAMQVIFAPK